MRLSGNFLSDLNAATQGASDFPLTEAVVEIPPIILPIIKVPRPYDLPPPPLTTQCRQSTVASLVTQVANAAQAFVLFLSLGRGLWRIHAESEYSSNYDGGAIITAGINMLDPNGVGVQITAHSAAGAAFNTQTHRCMFDLLLKQDNYGLYNFLTVNGVGQSHRLCSVVIAQKFI